MKKSIIILLCVFILSSCEQLKDTPGKALDGVGDNASDTFNRAREYIGIPRKPPKKPQENTQPRFCYRSFVDITCYAEPIPGQERRLVAYQGSHGQTGYIIKSSPPKQDDIKSSAPVSLPPLKSETVNPPTPILGVNDPKPKKLKEIIFDPAELMPKDLVPQKTE